MLPADRTDLAGRLPACRSSLLTKSGTQDQAIFRKRTIRRVECPGSAYMHLDTGLFTVAVIESDLHSLCTRPYRWNIKQTLSWHAFLQLWVHRAMRADADEMSNLIPDQACPT